MRSEATLAMYLSFITDIPCYSDCSDLEGDLLFPFGITSKISAIPQIQCDADAVQNIRILIFAAPHLGYRRLADPWQSAQILCPHYSTAVFSQQQKGNENAQLFIRFYRIITVY